MMKKTIKQLLKFLRIIRANDGRSEASAPLPEEMLPFPQPAAGAVKLNIGGGKGHPRFDDWKIVDLRGSCADIKMDITKERLPFEDSSVDVIFASHILEHIYPQQLGFVLAEFNRVLKPRTGLLRVSVPDIRKAIMAYMRKDYYFFAKSSISTYRDKLPLGGLLASWFYSTRVFNDPSLKHGDGHLHSFDSAYLAWWLKKSNFKHVWESAYRGSVVDELKKDGFDLHKNDSLYMEAVK